MQGRYYWIGGLVGLAMAAAFLARHQNGHTPALAKPPSSDDWEEAYLKFEPGATYVYDLSTRLRLEFHAETDLNASVTFHGISPEGTKAAYDISGDLTLSVYERSHVGLLLGARVDLTRDAAGGFVDLEDGALATEIFVRLNRDFDVEELLFEHKPRIEVLNYWQTLFATVLPLVPAGKTDAWTVNTMDTLGPHIADYVREGDAIRRTKRNYRAIQGMTVSTAPGPDTAVIVRQSDAARFEVDPMSHALREVRANGEIEALIGGTIRVRSTNVTALTLTRVEKGQGRRPPQHWRVRHSLNAESEALTKSKFARRVPVMMTQPLAPVATPTMEDILVRWYEGAGKDSNEQILAFSDLVFRLEMHPEEVARLKEMIRDQETDEDLRAHLIQAAGASDTREGGLLLQELIATGSPKERTTAISTAMQLSDPPEGLVDSLSNLLRGGPAQGHQEVSAAVLTLGSYVNREAEALDSDAVFQELVAYGRTLQSATDRLTFMTALGNTGRTEAIEHIINTAIAQSSPGAWRTAISSIGQVATPEAHQYLMDWYESNSLPIDLSHMAVRSVATNAVNPTEQVTQFMALVASDTEAAFLARQAAARFLARSLDKVGSEVARPVLESLAVTDPDDRIMRFAQESLARSN